MRVELSIASPTAFRNKTFGTLIDSDRISLCLGHKDLPEKEDFSNIQLQTVLPIGGDAGAHVPELL